MYRSHFTAIRFLYTFDSTFYILSPLLYTPDHFSNRDDLYYFMLLRVLYRTSSHTLQEIVHGLGGQINIGRTPETSTSPEKRIDSSQNGVTERFRWTRRLCWGVNVPCWSSLMYSHAKSMSSCRCIFRLFFCAKSTTPSLKLWFALLRIEIHFTCANNLVCVHVLLIIGYRNKYFRVF